MPIENCRLIVILLYCTVLERAVNESQESCGGVSPASTSREVWRRSEDTGEMEARGEERREQRVPSADGTGLYGGAGAKAKAFMSRVTHSYV